jgi:hypothetical protein
MPVPSTHHPCERWPEPGRERHDQPAGGHDGEAAMATFAPPSRSQTLPAGMRISYP